MSVEHIFNHVLDNVLNRDDSSRLKKALMNIGINDVASNAQIEEIKYDEKGKQLLIVAEANLLNLLSCYRRYRTMLGVPLTMVDWLHVTKQDFYIFRVENLDDYKNRLLSSNITTTINHSPTVTTPLRANYTPAEVFKRE